MKLMFSNDKTRQLKHATLQRHLPKEWRQTSEERQDWQHFRLEQMKRRESYTPLARLDSVLTSLGQIA